MSNINAISRTEAPVRDALLAELVDRLPFADGRTAAAVAAPLPAEISLGRELMGNAQVIFELLIHAYGDPQGVDPVWIQEAIDRCYDYACMSNEDAETSSREIGQQIHRIRGLFEVSMPRLRDLAKNPWGHKEMVCWLNLMKFEIDTAANDFE